MKQLTTYEALIRLNSLYMQFLMKPKQREHIIQEIEAMTQVVCEDEHVLPGIQQRVQGKLKHYQNMIKEI